MTIEKFLLIITNHHEPDKKILKVSDYKGLTKRDAEWLKKILNNEKYQKIAIEEGLTEGTVKNRMKAVYEILEVGDKTGFQSEYLDFEIVY